MTKPLYHLNAYQTEFEARVVDRIDIDGKPGIILDQTCFYPTGGGQECDHGVLNDIPVVEVVRENEEIVHITKKPVTAAAVRGRIDWKRRFDFMQQHSGQHLLSQSLLRNLEADTVSAHLGASSSTVEINRPTISTEEIEATEAYANHIVFEDREIKTYFVSSDDVRTLPIRKVPPREGRLRIVEIDGYDHSACGGTHCHRTGEIGLIKVGRWEKIRKNVRLQFLCGRRAMMDFQWKNRVIETLAERYSAGASDVFDLVVKQGEENRELRKKLKHATDRVMTFEVRELLSTAEQAGGVKVIQAVFDHRPVEELKTLANRLIETASVVVLFGNRGEKGQLVFTCNKQLPHDMNALMKDVCSTIGGKGGGSPHMAFGGGPDPDAVEDAVGYAGEQIKQHA